MWTTLEAASTSSKYLYLYLYLYMYVDRLGGGVDVLHDEDDVLEAELDWHLVAHHHVLLVEHDVHQHLVGRDAREGHVDD